MGVFTNISDRTRRRFGRHGLASILAAIVLIALMGAAASFADTGEIHPDGPVSTSPADLVKQGSAETRPAAAIATDDPPLTRAATQLRIDEMSPARWLSQFGSVSIGHRE